MSSIDDIFEYNRENLDLDLLTQVAHREPINLRERCNTQVAQLRLRQKISDIESILASGEATASIDGTSTTVDFAVLESQLSDIRRRLNPARKPRVATFNLGGEW